MTADIIQQSAGGKIREKNIFENSVEAMKENETKNEAKKRTRSTLA